MILSFNFDWFTTVPGLLIAGGVVLLIIAVILFVLGGKKNTEGAVVENIEKAEALASEVASAVEPVQETVSQVSEPVVEVPTVEAPVSQEPVVSFEEPVAVPVEPVSIDTPVNEVQMSEPVVQESAVSFEEPVVVPTEPVSIPVEEPVVTPEVAVEIPAEEDFDKTQISVFGDTIVPTEEPKTSIYGGFDPLEATQNLPKVEEHHEPYGGAEVKIVEPVDETVVEIPQAEPIQVEVNEQPVAVEAPVVEPQTEVSNNIEEL